MKTIQKYLIEAASDLKIAKAIIKQKDSGKVLLLRKANTNDSIWDLPGGYVQKNESPADALRKALLFG